MRQASRIGLIGLLLLLGLALPAGAQFAVQGVTIQTAPKAATPAGQPTSTAVDANPQGLDVYIRGGGGTGGTAATDNSAFTGGATSVTPMGALYDTTPPAITDGNVGAPRMS